MDTHGYMMVIFIKWESSSLLININTLLSLLLLLLLSSSIY